MLFGFLVRVRTKSAMKQKIKFAQNRQSRDRDDRLRRFWVSGQKSRFVDFEMKKALWLIFFFLHFAETRERNRTRLNSPRRTRDSPERPDRRRAIDMWQAAGSEV